MSPAVRLEHVMICAGCDLPMAACMCRIEPHDARVIVRSLATIVVVCLDGDVPAGLRAVLDDLAREGATKNGSGLLGLVNYAVGVKVGASDRAAEASR